MQNEAEALNVSVELPDIRAGIRLLARLARVAERTCLSTGISLPQYRLLVAVSGESQRASELADAVGVSRPTLTALVDGLENSGMVKRVPEPSDRRGIRLELTDAGRVAIEDAERALTERLLGLVPNELGGIVEAAGGIVEGFASALNRESKSA